MDDIVGKPEAVKRTGNTDRKAMPVIIANIKLQTNDPSDKLLSDADALTQVRGNKDNTLSFVPPGRYMAHMQHAHELLAGSRILKMKM